MLVCVAVCLCSIVRGSTAGLVEFPDFWYLETFNAAAEDHSDPDHDHSHQLLLDADQPLVTAVDLEHVLKLRPATDDEAQRFDEVVEPVMLGSNRRRATGPRVTSRRVASPPGDKQQAANEIRRVVNKFVVSAAEDRGQELTDALEDESNPTVTVYFKGDYSVISITCERQVWNFIIRPPSPLPNWFYSDHINSVGTEQAMDIPEDVQKDFYTTLLRLLKVFLRFDL